MLICGEDLGMVPDSVPVVLKRLGLLSLEVQRWPKRLGQRFGNPADYPYLSVCTTSTHDMSTIRGWWEEEAGDAPGFLDGGHAAGRRPRRRSARRRSAGSSSSRTWPAPRCGASCRCRTGWGSIRG